MRCLLRLSLPQKQPKTCPQVIQNIKIEENRFGFEPEITAKIARRHLRVFEVSISYFPRSNAEGKHIGWKDGVRAIWCIFKYGIWRRNHNVMVINQDNKISISER